MLAAVRHAVTANAGSKCNHLFQATRGMALEGARGFSEHEIAVENRYFNKEDERLLTKLLKKVKTATEEADKGVAATAKAAEEAALRQIIGKYKVSKEDFDAIIAWKHSHY